MKALKEYYKKNNASKTALLVWGKFVTRANWSNLNELKNDFPTADYVGNQRVIFNIKDNHYRVICVVTYGNKSVLVRWIGTHKEYDRLTKNKILTI